MSHISLPTMNDCLTNTISSLDVVVLCGGKGSRLQSVVNDRPKPMAAFGDKPFLHLLIKYMAVQGFRRFILCAGYKADVIESYFKSASAPSVDWKDPSLRKSEMGDCNIMVCREETLLGTAGALRHALECIQSERILVINGDSFCALNYGETISSHIANSADVTMVLSKVMNNSDFGTVIIDDDLRVKSFREKHAGSTGGYVNAGVYVFKRSVVDSMDQKVPLSLEHDVFPGLIKTRFFAYITNSLLLDIGTPERYESAKKVLITEMGKDIKTL